MIQAEALREAVIALAQQAADAILTVYGRDFEVEAKPDASPLTEADLAAHRIILTGLAALTPEVPVISEESAHQIPAAQRRGWRRLWLVDPLDGTREFIKRNGEFTVNIAYVEAGVARWGVIHQPVRRLLWHGGTGFGSARREDGVDVPLQVRTAVPPFRTAVSRSHADARTAAAVAAMGDVERVSCGSSLKFCRIAEGALDVYPRFGPTSEWDTAAGQAIMEGAGGAVLLADGRALRYNQRDTLLNGDFLALADVRLPWRDWVASASAHAGTVRAGLG